METFPCGIYVHAPDHSKITYVFFQVVREDGDGQKSFEVVGWAKYKNWVETNFNHPPMETGFFNLIMPEEVKMSWDFVKDLKPTEYPYTAEIVENTICIYHDDEIRLTLTNYQ